VNEQADIRHKKVADERNMNIMMDPEIARIYQASTAVSTSNGNSFNLMKMTAKRRRGKQQIKEEQQEADLRQREITEKLARIDAMEARLEQQSRKLSALEETENHHEFLVRNGLLKPDG
jgi:small-conductance mechanosensitive channel